MPKPLTPAQMRFRAMLADGLSVANGVSGVAGVLVLLLWPDPRALLVACIFVFAGWGFDSVDGLAARGVVRSPAEGIVLDSLCDVSSFGVLPSVLLSAYGFSTGDRVMQIVTIVLSVAFVSCVILRLRRYTVNAIDHSSEQRTSFYGVPSPVAAMSTTMAILAAITGPPMLAWLPIAFAAVTTPLMLSQVPYQETPRVFMWMVRAKWPLPVLAAIAYAAGNVPIALSIFFASYLVSGALLNRSN